MAGPSQTIYQSERQIGRDASGPQATQDIEELFPVAEQDLPDFLEPGIFLAEQVLFERGMAATPKPDNAMLRSKSRPFKTPALRAAFWTEFGASIDWHMSQCWLPRVLDTSLGLHIWAITQSTTVRKAVLQSFTLRHTFWSVCLYQWWHDKYTDKHKYPLAKRLEMEAHEGVKDMVKEAEERLKGLLIDAVGDYFSESSVRRYPLLSLKDVPAPSMNVDACTVFRSVMLWRHTRSLRSLLALQDYRVPQHDDAPAPTLYQVVAPSLKRMEEATVRFARALSKARAIQHAVEGLECDTRYEAGRAKIPPSPQDFPQYVKDLSDFSAFRRKCEEKFESAKSSTYKDPVPTLDAAERAIETVASQAEAMSSSF